MIKRQHLIRQQKRTIVVNATALNQGGALSILRQFARAIPEDDFEYILFVSTRVDLDGVGRNVRLVGKDAHSYAERFIWDAFGAKTWFKRNNINPSAAISLQNTNFRTGKPCPNFVYYHQPIPFYGKKWNPLRSSERLLWFYKNIYPFFIRLFINDRTEFFVQIESIRESFARYFHIPVQKIHVVRPNIVLPVMHEVKPLQVDGEQFNLFYPASPILYKNHRVILEAIGLLGPSVQKGITLHLTCSKADMERHLSKQEIQFKINYAGKMPYDDVLGMYRAADAMLFPSFIESFGLPLLEAASFGLPVIAADKPYSRDVLKGYEGVSYAGYDDPGSWSKRILELFWHKGKKFKPIQLEPSGSWPELFGIVKDKIT